VKEQRPYGRGGVKNPGPKDLAVKCYQRVYAVGGWRSASLEVGGTLQRADRSGQQEERSKLQTQSKCMGHKVIGTSAKYSIRNPKSEITKVPSAFSSFGALLNHHNGNSSVLCPPARKAVVPYWFDFAAGKSIHAL